MSSSRRLLLGTDWPMLPPDKLKHFVDYVPEALAAYDAERILDVNAASLLGLADDANRSPFSAHLDRTGQRSSTGRRWADCGPSGRSQRL
jgi:hypothetical protein